MNLLNLWQDRRRLFSFRQGPALLLPHNLYPLEGLSMFNLGSIASGLSKSVIFLVTIFTKTNTVVSQLSKLTPGVLAAMLAVFYDVIKAAIAAESAAESATTGNVMGAITLSETTLTLVKTVASDAKSAEQLVVADLKTLGIINA